MVRPLFILGKQRSGTTWLANQLCEHSLIAGVRHKQHHGIHESAYFSDVYGRYGNLSYKPNFVEFVEVVAASDYFRLLGVDKEFLYSLWPATYEDIFRKVMDVYAQRQGATYWLEKSPDHTVLVEKLSTIYPDAKFIAIIRDVEDVVSSTIVRYSRIKRRRLTIMQNVFGWVYNKKVIESFAEKSDKIHVTRYERLKANTESVLREMCNFLEIDFDEAMLEQAFERNTSFKGGKDRQQVLSTREKDLIKWVARCAQVLPLPVMNQLKYVQSKIKSRRGLPRWFFNMHPFLKKLND